MPTAAQSRRPIGSTVQRIRKPGVDLVLVSRGDIHECHFTFRPLAGDRAGQMLWRLEAQLREYAASIVKIDIFGHVAAYADTVARLRRLLPEERCSIAWVDRGDKAPTPVAGIQVFAVSGVQPRTLTIHDQPVAQIFDDGFARHAFISVSPQELNPKPRAQAREVFEQLAAALDLAEMRMTNVVRTWLFLDGITRWYDEFNAVRTKFFREHGVFDALVPASTGIGARNPYGAALSASAWAMVPHGELVSDRELASPLQCPAPQYGSSFSRAVEIASPGQRRVLVSGTASIEPGGATAHAGDIDKQIDLTMQVVEAILHRSGMGFHDASRATIYFKDLQHGPRFSAWCERHKLSHLPAVAIQADVCRDDLLFELELDAMIAARVQKKPREE